MSCIGFCVQSSLSTPEWAFFSRDLSSLYLLLGGVWLRKRYPGGQKQNPKKFMEASLTLFG